ncbi:hypothetical protein Tco_0601273 [Tanacetum coccineum]
METNNTKSVETNASMESRQLDLPDLAIKTILEKLEPTDLCIIIIGLDAQKKWQLHIASQKEPLSSFEDVIERRGFLMVYLSKHWSVVMLKSSYNDGRKSS